MSDFLRVEGLSKSYPSGDSIIEVLRGLSLTLEKGQMIAVTGESGSGKSTLLHLLGGMEQADSGTIEIGGVEITRLARDQLAEHRNRKVGFVFQFHHLLPEFSALENVMFPLLIRHSGFSEAEAAARSLLTEVGLAERIAHKPGELSGGEQQRVAIARALTGRPELFLADEPTGNLDVGTSQAIHQLLQDIHVRYGLTSIIVTHNPVLASLCPLTKSLADGNLR